MSYRNRAAGQLALKLRSLGATESQIRALDRFTLATTRMISDAIDRAREAGIEQGKQIAEAMEASGAEGLERRAAALSHERETLAYHLIRLLADALDDPAGESHPLGRRRPSREQDAAIKALAVVGYPTERWEGVLKLGEPPRPLEPKS